MCALSRITWNVNTGGLKESRLGQRGEPVKWTRGLQVLVCCGRHSSFSQIRYFHSKLQPPTHGSVLCGERGTQGIHPEDSSLNATITVAEHCWRAVLLRVFLGNVKWWNVFQNDTFRSVTRTLLKVTLHTHNSGLSHGGEDHCGSAWWKVPELWKRDTELLTSNHKVQPIKSPISMNYSFHLFHYNHFITTTYASFALNPCGTPFLRSAWLTYRQLSFAKNSTVKY